jgi:Asp-tRNA(Asn)/Glu-tRNA(Gln) amidotransferase B subunit
MNSFQDLQVKVQKELQNDLKLKKIDVVQLMTALYLLSEQKDETSFRDAMQIFSSDFNALARVLNEEKEAEKVKDDQDIQLVITDIIRNNPELAGKVAKLAGQKNLSKEKLLSEFPELSNYFEQK